MSQNEENIIRSVPSKTKV